MDEDFDTPSSFESAESPSIPPIDLPPAEEPRRSYTSSRSHHTTSTSLSRQAEEIPCGTVESNGLGLGFLDLGKEGGKSSSSPPRIILGRRGRKSKRMEESENEKRLEEIDLRGPELIPIPLISPRREQLNYNDRRGSGHKSKGGANVGKLGIPTPPSSNPASTRLPNLPIPPTIQAHKSPRLKAKLRVEVIKVKEDSVENGRISNFLDWLALPPPSSGEGLEAEIESGKYVKSPSLLRPHPQSFISSVRRIRNRGIFSPLTRLILVFLLTIIAFLSVKRFASTPSAGNVNDSTPKSIRISGGNRNLEPEIRRSRERILGGPTKIERVARVTSSTPFPPLPNQFQLPPAREDELSGIKIAINAGSSETLIVNRIDSLEVEGDMVEILSEAVEVKDISYAERKKEWELQKTNWDEFNWIAPAPHSSLVLQLALLTTKELDWRNWILEYRTTPLLERSKMRSYEGGEYGKYSDLTIDFKNLVDKCEGVTGLERYRVLHDEMLESKISPKFISSALSRGTTLSHQLLNQISTFHIALLSSRAYIMPPIFSSVEIPFTKLFSSPNSIEWGFHEFDPRFSRVIRGPGGKGEAGIVVVSGEAISDLFGSNGGGKKREGIEPIKELSRSGWISLSKPPSVYPAFSSPILNPLSTSLNLQPHKATACLLSYVFAPRPIFTDFTNLYTSLLSLPTIFSVGIELNLPPSTTKTLPSIDSYFTCAMQLAKTYSTPKQRIIYYLSTNSPSLIPAAQRILGKDLLLSGVGEEENSFVKELLELEIFKKTDYKIITTGSDLGKLVTLVGKRGRTVSIPPLLSGGVDCRLENAFTTFDRL